jgi:hypothetical protein
MPEHDYFPFKEGRSLEYQGAADVGPEAGSYRKLEILRVIRDGERTSAQCRWTYDGKAGQNSRETTLSCDAAWLSGDTSFLEMPSEKLFPIPPSVGRRWNCDRWNYEVVSSDLRVRIGEDFGAPLVFKDCLRVVWFCDEGGGELVFAPGIGLVKALSTDEQYPFNFFLTRVLEEKL